MEECDPLQNIDLETKYINEYNSLYPNGYNLSPTGGISSSGGSHSDETREKIRNSMIGKNLGKTHSEGAKEKIRQYRMGKSHSAEVIEKMKQPKSEETKQRISESRMGIEPWNKGIKLK